VGVRRHRLQGRLQTSPCGQRCSSAARHLTWPPAGGKHRAVAFMQPPSSQDTAALTNSRTACHQPTLHMLFPAAADAARLTSSTGCGGRSGAVTSVGCCTSTPVLVQSMPKPTTKLSSSSEGRGRCEKCKSCQRQAGHSGQLQNSESPASSRLQQQCSRL